MDKQEEFDIKAFAASIQAKIDKLGETAAEKEFVESLRLEIEKVRAIGEYRPATAPADFVGDFDAMKADGLYHSPGRYAAAWLKKSADEGGYGQMDALRAMRQRKGDVAMRAGRFFPTRRELEQLEEERKTTITSATVGSATPGILSGQVVGYVPATQRRLTMRDLLNARPLDRPSADFPKENAFTNAASPQVEASVKDESACWQRLETDPGQRLVFDPPRPV